MNLPSRPTSRTWLLIPLCAAGFLAWIDYGRVQRVQYVSGVDREDAVVDPASPTGYAGGQRWLIVPEHDSHTYQWIAETQQMLARGEWRIRHVDYENAPLGRDVHSASLYRWWLGLIAWCDHALAGRPLGLSVERAALFADPVLHLLLLAAMALYVARRFGVYAALGVSLGLVTLYPLAAAFLPGVPDYWSLALICALWSLLPLLSGTVRALWLPPASPDLPGEAPDRGRESRRIRASFLLAGVAGGVGLWVSASSEVPILVGTALGGAAAAWATRRRPPPAPKGAAAIPWRVWSLAGATTSLLAYLVEYYPAHLDLRLQVNHPLYGIAWIGVGEVLTWLWIPRGQAERSWNLRSAAVLTLATTAIGALPVALALTGTRTIITGDALSSRLTNLPNGIVATNLAAWLARDGFNATVGATCLPLLLLVAAVWLSARRGLNAGRRAALVVALGPALVLVALACHQLRWWSMLDAILLVLVAVAADTDAAVDPGRHRWWWGGLVGLVLAVGATQLVPAAGAGGKNEFTKLEVEGLIERALAHWIAVHTGPGGAVVLVPPDRTVSLCFYGGLRGLGTPNWENRDGLDATARIVSATTSDEAQALLEQRGVTHIILPSWDTDLDAFARWTIAHPEGAFINALERWALPPWIRPLPYPLPAIAGFEGQSVVVFSVTDETDRPASLGRLAEYFLEMQQLDLAAAASQALQRYPADLGALVAIAQVDKARADTAGFTKVFNELLSILSGGFDGALPWDRRVSLAALLAEGGRADFAREQVRRCLAEVDEARLRSLTTVSLFRLQALGKAFGLEISNPRLRELARELLPADLRQRL